MGSGEASGYRAEVWREPAGQRPRTSFRTLHVLAGNDYRMPKVIAVGVAGGGGQQGVAQQLVGGRAGQPCCGAGTEAFRPEGEVGLVVVSLRRRARWLQVSGGLQVRIARHYA